MDNAGRMGSGQALGKLCTIVRRLARRELEPAQRAAVHQFPYDIEQALLVAVVENGNDIRMIDGARRARLHFEPLAQARVHGGIAGQRLDGNGTVQLRIMGAIHFAHPARSEQRLDYVTSNAVPALERHSPPVYRYLRFRFSSSSRLRGQSVPSRRERARSASNFPPVWQVAQ